MDITQKLIACAAAMTMLIGTASCAKEEGEHDHDHNIVGDDIAADANVSADNMPFGANEVIMSSDDSGNVPITICYDDRYITDTEASMISKYFSSLNNNDVTMFSSVIYAPYLSAIMASTDKFNTTEDYLTAQNQSLTNMLGDGFRFDYIYFKDGLFSGDYDFTDYDAVVFANEPSAQITDRKLLTAEIEYTNSLGNGSYVTDINVCLYTIDGVPYILR